MGVDTKNLYPSNGPGRPSVRISSVASYTHALYILNLSHMPTGCGTWPAFWSLGPNWPSNGEIDIIEGVNTNTQNLMSLHTSDNCTVAGTNETGTLQTSNCYINANSNSGCGVQSASTTSYGSGFNSNGGGVYAMEWTSSWIRVWSFGRNSIPASITDGTPDPSTFGTPSANFQGSCNIDSHFALHNIVFDNTFCGDYAGNTYGSDASCPQTSGATGMQSCINYVGNNPSAFAEAYWSINSLKVYQVARGASSSAGPSPTSLSSVIPIAATTSLSVSVPALGNSSVVSSASLSVPTTSNQGATSTGSTYVGSNTITATPSTASSMPPSTSSASSSITFSSTASSSSVASSATSSSTISSSSDASAPVVPSTYTSASPITVPSSALTSMSQASQTSTLSISNSASKSAQSYLSYVTATPTATTASVASSFSALPTLPVVPQCHSIYADDRSNYYRIYCHGWLFGKPIQTIQDPPDFASCIKSCTGASDCFGAVYNNATTPATCTLKTRHYLSQRDYDPTSGEPGTFVALYLDDPYDQTPSATTMVTSSTAIPTTTISVSSKLKFRA